jgi:hypothetical protein
VQADPGQRQADPRNPIDQLQPAPDALSRLREVEHHPVTEQLHRTAAATVGELVDDLDQPAGQFGRGPVAALLGELGVAGKIQEGDRRGSDRAAAGQSGPLQGRLGPEHGHVQHVVLEVPTVEQNQRALQAGHHGGGDLIQGVRDALHVGIR